jgi:hypothetical protein
MRGRAGWVGGGKVVGPAKMAGLHSNITTGGKSPTPRLGATLRVAARLRFELGLGPQYGLAGGRIEC